MSDAPERIWISVKDRLPNEVNPMILIYSEDEFGSYINKGYLSLNTWYLAGQGLIVKEKVTHWMPLPDKPDKQLEGESGLLK